MISSLQAAIDIAPVASPSGTADGAMVIGQICHGSMGGSSRMACRLANALSRRGHIVHVFSRDALPWPLDARIEQHACRPAGQDIEAPLYWDWTEADQAAFSGLLTARMTAQHFDILHYHYALPFAGLLGRVAGSLGKQMPFVVGTFHGTDLTRCLRDARAFSSIGRDLAVTGELTTVSEHMRKLAGSLPGRGPLLRVLPNFVEDDWPGAGFRPDLPALPGRPSILHVSNFRTVKDVGLLGRLFVAIHAQTDAELRLVGDGPEMPVLRRFLDASPAAAAVRYAGVSVQPDVYFRDATLFLSTSMEEGFGLAVLEAMASGLPVAATAVGGIPELVEDDVTGLLFDPDDFDRTVRRIVSVLGSPERLEALRRAAFARAEKMRESRVIALYEDLYRAKLQGWANLPAG